MEKNWRKVLLKEAFVIDLLGKTSSWQFLGWNQSQRKNFLALTFVALHVVNPFHPKGLPIDE